MESDSFGGVIGQPEKIASHRRIQDTLERTCQQDGHRPAQHASAKAGFKLNLTCEEETKRAVILVDTDSFTQIVINLVDCTIKFSTKAEKKRD